MNNASCTEMPKQFYAVVPAAGVGRRMGANRPKQYLPILDKTLLEWTLEKLISHPLIKHIILPVSLQDEYFAALPIANADWITTVPGGKERADSVLAGLKAIPEADWVLVHDAARPCVKHSDIDRLLALVKTDAGGILATPVRDTMKRASKDTPNQVSHSEERNHLWHALTPQFFPKQQLQNALEEALQKGLAITDEASAIENKQGKVILVEGCSSNIKVTHPQDIRLAEFYLTMGENND